MRLLLSALLSIFAIAATAAAEDVPLPLKKPKDAKGQPVTSSEPPPAAASEPAKAGAKAAPAGTTPAAAKATPPGKDGGNWPKTLDDAKAEADAKAKPEAVPTEWPAEEIAAAQALCKTILDKIDAVAIPEDPFRQGECGAAAPVRLVSIGRKPEVVLSPPAVLTCGMVGALHTWLTKDLQPLARKTLGAEIIRIESMSDYSCRNAYGRTKTKLSEHGRANALDIRGFVTANGETAVVLKGWGETKRDIAARELALKQAAEKAAAEAARLAAPTVPPPADGKPATAAQPPTDTAATPGVRDTIVEGVPRAAAPPAFGVGPSHLGGPVAEPPARMRTFLKGAHAAACEIFGTTLGPEANNAHRNHFHVDMAPRKVKKICD
jgi:hypothetical protein